MADLTFSKSKHFKGLLDLTLRAWRREINIASGKHFYFLPFLLNPVSQPWLFLSDNKLFCLQVIAASVCHTDSEQLYQSQDGMKPRPFPMVLGHEAAGVVESVGPGVTKFRPGNACGGGKTSGGQT